MQKGPFGENSYGAACRMVHLARIHMAPSSARSFLQKFGWRRAQQGPFSGNSDGAALGKVLLAKIRMVWRAKVYGHGRDR